MSLSADIIQPIHTKILLEDPRDVMLGDDGLGMGMEVFMAYIGMSFLCLLHYCM